VISKLTKVVGFLGGRVALQQLVPFLEHEDARVRANTVEGMVDIPGEEKYQYLLRLLEDPSPRVQGNVAVALQGMGAEEFAGVVARLVHSADPGPRRSALYVLGQLPPAAAYAHLRDLTRDNEPDIQRAAIARLGQQGTPQAVEALVEVARENPTGDIHAIALTALRAVWHGRPEDERKALVDQLAEFAGPVARPEAAHPGRPPSRASSVEVLASELSEAP
jgi:HEAT repeat protein